MAFIKLTFRDGTKGRFRIDAIAAYCTDKFEGEEITHVTMLGVPFSKSWLVKETPAEIDELIAAADKEGKA